MPTIDPQHHADAREPLETNRRGFIKGVAAAGAVAGGPALVASAKANDKPGAPPDRQDLRERAGEAFALRRNAALRYFKHTDTSPPANSGDEAAYPDRRACFFKTLPQNEYGEVDRHAYRMLLRALERGTSAAMERVPLSVESDRGLANPLAAHAFDVIGPDAWSLRMPPAPAFASDVQAAEMGEVYWQALTRDVPFTDYATDPDIHAAAHDLNRFSHRLGADEAITPATLFRGETRGDAIGPYISQFLWLPASWGPVPLDQRFAAPLAGNDFGLDPAEWLYLQRGGAPTSSTGFVPVRRYLATGRDLAEYVHNDVVYQAYQTAALVLLGMGADALDPQNPYLESANQGGFVTFGTAEIVDLVAKTAHSALKAAWFQKWLVHRRLRPEVFAARVEFQASGARSYGINEEIMNCEAAARLASANGNLLLPLAYPEGSPTHPAYPAGHATVAGACVTILKALFDEAYEIPAPVEASRDGLSLLPWTGAPLTVGNELNKLASNISLGRDTAGVHYRSDGVDGLDLGEQVALGILADYAGTRAEQFAGFELTLFDGTSVMVSGDGVSPRRGRPRWRRRRPRFQQEY
ncbi:MAG: vanadium-dependent haloperoxidase [Gammaproteobacteria bacterium]